MTRTPTGRGAVRWHPPRPVLDLVELAVTGGLDPRLALAQLPPDIRAAAAEGDVVVEDVERAPVALLSAAGLSPARPDDPSVVAAPSADRGRRLVAVIGGPPAAEHLGEARGRAYREGRPLTWLVLTGAGRSRDLPAARVLQIMNRLAQSGEDVVGVPVPVLADAGAEAAVVRDVAGRFGGEVLTFEPVRAVDAHPAFADEALRRRPEGVTVFLTGLSGSGKSTLARRLTERLTGDAALTVTLLDGDAVRRVLSPGLGFTPADIDLNIRRIAFVAAEVSRHGGIAVCAPIAPFAAGRAAARAVVEEAGGAFVLVHVATPLAECERRDRKGLYAAARAGDIPDMIGIGTPYEPPQDADLVVDTTGREVEACVDIIWELLGSRGLVKALTKDF